MRRWFNALITLIIGVMFGYVYKQGEVNNLTKQVSALETKVTEAAIAAARQIEKLNAELDTKTTLADEQQAEIEELNAEAATQIEELKAELDTKTTLAGEQQAEIEELKAALKVAKSANTIATEPTPTPPTSLPDSPTTASPQ